MASATSLALTRGSVFTILQVRFASHTLQKGRKAKDTTTQDLELRTIFVSSSRSHFRNELENDQSVHKV